MEESNFFSCCCYWSKSSLEPEDGLKSPLLSMKEDAQEKSDSLTSKTSNNTPSTTLSSHESPQNDTENKEVSSKSIDQAVRQLFVADIDLDEFLFEIDQYEYDVSVRNWAVRKYNDSEIHSIESITPSICEIEFEINLSERDCWRDVSQDYGGFRPSNREASISTSYSSYFPVPSDLLDAADVAISSSELGERSERESMASSTALFAGLSVWHTAREVQEYYSSLLSALGDSACPRLPKLLTLHASPRTLLVPTEQATDPTDPTNLVVIASPLVSSAGVSLSPEDLADVKRDARQISGM